MAYGFWINNRDCYGCKTCSIACKSEKRLGPGVLLRTVRETVQGEPLAQAFLSMSCNHCEEPACMAVCPVGAYTKLENGIVRQDHELCIGCQMCIEACPYDAPCYDEEEAKTYKCDLCADRLEQGLPPACVASCPGANLAWGEVSDLVAEYGPDIVSDPACDTMPNVCFTVDPRLTAASDEELVALITQRKDVPEQV